MTKPDPSNQSNVTPPPARNVGLSVPLRCSCSRPSRGLRFIIPAKSGGKCTCGDDAPIAVDCDAVRPRRCGVVQALKPYRHPSLLLQFGGQTLVNDHVLRPPSSCPARPERRPAAASQRSLQACIASLPLRSSLMSKTCLKSDHFNGGGSRLIYV